MQRENELVLSAAALPEEPSTMAFEIFSDTRDVRGKKELEGKITFNPERCHIFFLPPLVSTQTRPVITPDRTKWDLYLVVIPFTLHQAPGDRYYEEMTFYVEMAHPQVTAFDLFPRTITTKIEETRSYTLSPQIKFMEAEVSLGEIGRQWHFEVLRPTIIASGEGESTFYWVHKGFKEQKEVIPETKHALVVLQVPHGTPYVDATISYEVVIVRKLLGKHAHGSTSPRDVRWQLQGAPSFFASPTVETETLPANHHPKRLQAPPQAVQAIAAPGTTHSEHFDVCVVCGMPEETTAFIHATEHHCGVHFTKAFSPHSNSEYHHTQIRNNNGEPLSIHVSWQPSYGPLEAGLHLKPLLDQHRPFFTAMTGICAGDRRKVKLGDLVVADRAFIYDGGKISTTRDGQTRHQPDPDIRHADQHTLHFARMFDGWQAPLATLPRPRSKHQQRDWLLNRLLTNPGLRVDDIPAQELVTQVPDWQKIVRELQEGAEPFLTPGRQLRDPATVYELRFHEDGFPYQDPKEVSCHIAPMASGSAVRADAPFDSIQRIVRGTAALDMEGAAFYRTVADFPGIRALLAKGICDYADSDKDDTYHHYAATASALYMLSFIQAYITSERISTLHTR